MDREAIEEQYRSSANLAARIALHRECSTNPYGLQRWFFDRLALAPGQRVLEIACGTGSLWSDNRDRLPSGLRLIVSDISPGMVETTRLAVPGAAAYVACALPDLPFGDDLFDLAIANHMLYHVNERQRGLLEIRRVLRHGGTLFAATNGREHLREIKALMSDFGIEGGDVSASFTLENGEEPLRQVFGEVRREDYPDALRVTDPELLLRYVASISPRVEARREEMRAAVAARIAADGAFHVVKSTGAFTVAKV
ncbi:MAG TPA: class I SAM-dependent methyltransferase [Thermoanaerobaculia bacterium]|jgi:SAM-dependent methyltransferase|nr:class I SAM-dependent methyltransferase [Thermoanaerobaculia bacterium]